MGRKRWSWRWLWDDAGTCQSNFFANERSRMNGQSLKVWWSTVIGCEADVNPSEPQTHDTLYQRRGKKGNRQASWGKGFFFLLGCHNETDPNWCTRGTWVISMQKEHHLHLPRSSSTLPVFSSDVSCDGKEDGWLRISTLLCPGDITSSTWLRHNVSRIDIIFACHFDKLPLGSFYLRDVNKERQTKLKEREETDVLTYPFDEWVIGLWASFALVVVPVNGRSQRVEKRVVGRLG